MTEPKSKTWDEQLEDSKNEGAEKLKALAPKLKEAGFADLTFHITGSGDSGEVEYYAATTLDGINVETYSYKAPDGKDELTKKLASFIEAHGLEEIAWDIAYGEYPGFENSDGGYGDLKLVAETGELTLEFAYYETVSEEQPTVNF